MARKVGGRPHGKTWYSLGSCFLHPNIGASVIFANRDVQALNYFRQLVPQGIIELLPGLAVSTRSMSRKGFPCCIPRPPICDSIFTDAPATLGFLSLSNCGFPCCILTP